MEEMLETAAPRCLARQLQDMSRQGVVREYRSRSVVLAEGERNDSLYVLLEGRARVVVGEAERREVVLAQLGPGDCFGELGYDAGPCAATVITVEPCRMLVVPREEFAAFVLGCPTFAHRFIQELIRKVRALTGTVRSLALLDARERVARLLAESAVTRDGLRYVPERPSQAEIASRVGCSREMVSRVLKDLVRSQSISLERDRIVING